jgi:hypothetical protein
MLKARKPKQGRKDDDQPNARAPDQGAAIDCLRCAHHTGRHCQTRRSVAASGYASACSTEASMRERRISRSREARAAVHELALDGRRRRSRRVACRDQASRRCRGDRTHIHTFAPARRGESPQPRGRLDRSARQAGTPFSCNRTELSLTKHLPQSRTWRQPSGRLERSLRRASTYATKIAKEHTA